jgi:hypothetical protein
MASREFRSPALQRVREMLAVPDVLLRFRDATAPWIAKFSLSHPELFEMFEHNE